MKLCRTVRPKREWHRWYAWHPVWTYGPVAASGYRSCCHWLEYVERRIHYSYYEAFTRSEYREIER